ncbi:MAG TPA: class I SAM-dependent methyltransferase [Verrucomicrobiota bacterium]|nr:class I SAM-dependent methyltransferase [Verrucomicrobiota bacterium]
MNEALRQESRRLEQSWTRHTAQMLETYLVADVEDPRINVQSLLTRHFLIFALSGRHFEMADAELRFAACLNWILRFAKENPDVEAMAGVRHALQCGADNAEGVELPHFLRETFRTLSMGAEAGGVSDYVSAALDGVAFDGRRPRLPASVLDTFMGLWRTALSSETSPPRRVLEPACGSANDYRFLEGCGLADRVDYTGFDLCEHNVRNARRLFPHAHFEVGNVFEIAAGDRSYDHSFVHDLFEHLSPEGIGAAVKELCRVTRRSLCLHFFNMDEIDAHVVRPVEEYHWSTLSLDRMMELFADEGFSGQGYHIGTYLRRRVGCEHTHNPHAYTLMLGTSTPAADRAL